jgi:hypothetical protein
MEQSEQRRPRHVARSTEPKEEETKTYRVKEGQTWGTNPELQAGDTVELTEAEAAGFEDKLEPVGGNIQGRLQGDDAATRGQLPAGAVSATTETVSPPVVPSLSTPAAGQADDSQAGKPAVPKRNS